MNEDDSATDDMNWFIHTPQKQSFYWRNMSPCSILKLPQCKSDSNSSVDKQWIDSNTQVILLPK